MSAAPSPLILWDVDHTLVSITGVSREIYARAYEHVIGRPLVYLADMAGRTEEAIIRETLVLNDVDPGHSFDAFYTALGDAARALEGQMRESGRALPGARETLAAFATTNSVQSVVTGNIKSIAVTKLEAFGLNSFVDFDIGGYGDDSSDRAVLVRLAIERAEAKYGYGFRPSHAVVIGDTPHDVKGALDNGALSVGVATGSSDVSELVAAGAHLVLPDLLDSSALHELVFNRR